MDGFSSPPKEAYGRVTNPERYRVVHAAAEALVDELVLRYDVTRSDGARTAAELWPRGNRLRAIHVQPNRDDAAPLLIAFSSFPGLKVRFGAWCEASYPHCGCDACDETPEAVIGGLRKSVAVVAAGRFREEITGSFKHWLQVEWVGDGWSSAGKKWLPRATFRRLEGRGRREWRAWPQRGGLAGT